MGCFWSIMVMLAVAERDRSVAIVYRLAQWGCSGCAIESGDICSVQRLPMDQRRKMKEKHFSLLNLNWLRAV